MNELNIESTLEKHLPTVETPPHLLIHVLMSIQAARVRRLRIRLGISMATFLASVASLIFYAPVLWREFQTTSFVEFVRLAISDPDIVFGNIKDLVLGLLEALPIDGIALSLIPMFILLGTLVVAQALYRERHPHIKSFFSVA